MRGGGDLHDGVAGQRREKARAVAQGDDFGGDSVFGELPLAEFQPDAASFEHVMSMILLVNEKVKYKVFIFINFVYDCMNELEILLSTA